MKRQLLSFAAAHKIVLALLLCGSLTSHAQTMNPGPQVLTFFSDVDDTEQPYGLYLPKNYDAKKKYPLVIMLHGAGSNHRLALRRVFGKSNTPGETDVEATRYFPEWKDIDFIVASPYARGTMGYQGVAEKDVYDVLADVKKRFSIDPDRTYLTGLSMGGGGTLWIGLTHPDIWAALVPVCPAPPKGTDQFTVNATNLPMHFFHGDADKAVPVTVSREWVKNIKALGGQVEYDEYPGVGHNSWEKAYADEAVFSWFSPIKRNLYPDRVRFNTTAYKYNRAYWLRIDNLTPGTLATVDANFTDANKLTVTTTGLNAFTLLLKNHPKIKSGQALQLTVNGKAVKTPAADSLTLVQANGKWIIGTLPPPVGKVKKAGAEGPISEAFASRHIYVYGTRDNPSPEELKTRMDMAYQAANWSEYRGAFAGRIGVFPRIVADKDVRPTDIKDANLVLFGTRETNLIIEQYRKELPMHLNASAKEYGLVYIYPVGGHYIVVSSGLPWWAGPQQPGFMPVALATLPGQKDYVLFKESLKTPVAEGLFDGGWNLATPLKEPVYRITE